MKRPWSHGVYILFKDLNIKMSKLAGQMLAGGCGIHPIRRRRIECGWDLNKGRMLISCRRVRVDLTDEVTS